MRIRAGLLSSGPKLKNYTTKILGTVGATANSEQQEPQPAGRVLKGLLL